jgi:hypothetical protein
MDTLDADDEQVLGTGVIGAVNDSTDRETEGHAEFITSITSYFVQLSLWNEVYLPFLDMVVVVGWNREGQVEGGVVGGTSRLLRPANH